MRIPTRVYSHNRRVFLYLTLFHQGSFSEIANSEIDKIVKDTNESFIQSDCHVDLKIETFRGKLISSSENNLKVTLLIPGVSRL